MINTKTLIAEKFSFYFIPLISGLIYLLSFYPGILSFDSLSQWDQITHFNFTNWHPAYSTIIYWFLTRLSYSPAILAFFQILIFSMVVGYGFCTFRDVGIPYILLIILDIGISLCPINGMMIITLWKDVLFSLAILLITIYLFKIIQTNGRWLMKRRNWLLFGILAANISLLRHNGFPLAIGVFLIGLLAFRYRRPWLKSLFACFIYIILITGPLFYLFDVDQSADKSQSLGVTLIHPIAAHIAAGKTLSSDEISFLEQIYPLNENWPYSCFDATVLFYRGVNFKPVQENPIKLATIFLRLTKDSPLTTLKHYYCLSSFVWKISQPNDVYLETVLTTNYDPSGRQYWKDYSPIVQMNPKLPEGRELIILILEKINQVDPGKIFWRPAIYLFLFIIAVMFYVSRRHHLQMLYILSPAILQTISIALTAQLQAVRYQYPVYLISLMFTIPLIYLGLVGRSGVDGNSE